VERRILNEDREIFKEIEALMAPGDGNDNRDLRQAGADNGTGADRSR
jgi:hypothetical protein